MEWLTSLCIPILVLAVGKIVDTSLRKSLEKRGDRLSEDYVHKMNKRSMVRRFVVMVLLVMYMPTILSCVRTFLCSDTVPKDLVLEQTDVFLLDNDASCDTFIFQAIHFVAIPYLIVMGVLMPLMLIFFTLRQRKWNLLYTQWFLYSPVYEVYKDRYCFWEAVPLVRNLAAIVITESYPLSPLIQTGVQLGMTGLYLVAVVALRPFRLCPLWLLDQSS